MLTLLLCWASGIVGFMACALLCASRDDRDGIAYCRHLVRRHRQREEARVSRRLSKHLATNVLALHRGADKAKRMIDGIPLADLTLHVNGSAN